MKKTMCGERSCYEGKAGQESPVLQHDTHSNTSFISNDLKLGIR